MLMGSGMDTGPILARMQIPISVRDTTGSLTAKLSRIAAQSLLEAGADVVATGCDSPAPIVAAAQAKKWGIGYDSMNACAAAPDSCLTATYWEWGPTYAKVMAEIRAGTWRPSDLYPDADSGLVALLGFEEGQVPARGIPEDAVAWIREKHA